MIKNEQELSLLQETDINVAANQEERKKRHFSLQLLVCVLIDHWV